MFLYFPIDLWFHAILCGLHSLFQGHSAKFTRCPPLCYFACLVWCFQYFACLVAAVMSSIEYNTMIMNSDSFFLMSQRQQREQRQPLLWFSLCPKPWLWLSLCLLWLRLCPHRMDRHQKQYGFSTTHTAHEVVCWQEQYFLQHSMFIVFKHNLDNLVSVATHLMFLDSIVSW